MYIKVIKPTVDFVLAFLALIVLSPIFLIVAILIKTTSQGPVFFTQKRVGINEKHFTIYKFRTMYTNAPSDMPTHLVESPEAHITGIGKILRKTSLDELPQLINILKGEMSIVGPRPALWNQFDLLELRAQNDSHLVKPGITGLAQVSGRDELDIDVKAKLDGEYASNINMMEDIKIIFITFEKIFKAQGVVEGKVDSSIEE